VPFDEPVAVAKLTGGELRTLCRQADGRRTPGVVDRWHAHVSGLELRRNGTGTVEARLSDGPIDDDATYTVATSDYLFHAEHEFPVLDEHHRVDRLDTQHEVLAAYAREQGIDPALEGRIELL